MNKKYLSVLVFGAMIAASTSTFMSCKDYDDDIDGLRTEIKDNATAAATELASKVEALKNQIGTLESANEKLNTELAAARQEASTAAANALAAAQKAQAAAEAAQKGGEQAAAAAAAAQKTADDAAKELANAVARVAALETKVASLEAAVADLKKADNDFSSKLAILENNMKLNQEAIATNKNGIAENKQAIADANAAILAKATELNSAINDLSAKIGAQIDVVNAELNTIKSNYATKDELNSKYQELVAMDAQLKSQIETNSNYVAALQTTVKELAAKDTELAAKIESNYNAVIEKLNATNTELTAASHKIAAIENTVSTLSTQYSALQSAKADITYVDNINNQLTTLVNSLQSTMNDLSTSNASQDRSIGELLVSVKALQEKAVALENQIEKNHGEINAALKEAVASLQKEMADAVTKAQGELTAAVEDVKTLAESNKEEIAQIKEDLAQKAEQSALDNLAADLLANVAEVADIQTEIADVKSDVANQKAELETKIAAAETAAKEYADAIVREAVERIEANETNIKNLQELVTQLTNIGGEDLSAFVTSTQMSDAINDAVEGLGLDINELREEIIAGYVTNDALSQQLAGYVDLESYNEKIAELEKALNCDEEGNLGLNQRMEVIEGYMKQLDLLANISKRLTSVTLVPDHYIDGIEAITFRTLQYRYNNKLYVLSNDKDTKAVYRLNPSGVTKDCIDTEKLEYVANMATNTRASVESPIMVTGCELDKDGDLVVSIRKTEKYSNENFATGQNGKFWIAALSVPINKKYWNEDDENAVVYSEYTRLSENRFTPTLAKAGDNGADRHLWSWNDLVTSSVKDKVYATYAYTTDPIDLMELVSVCEDNADHTPFTQEDYESYGLKIEFDIPTKPYMQKAGPGEPETDQQKFAHITDKRYLTSCAYGDANNSAAIGREPIVCARLVDTRHNNNVVSEKYFKIKWEKTTPKPLGVISESKDIFFCCGNYEQVLNTEKMNLKIYGNEMVNMGSETFHTIYPDANLKKESGVGTVYCIKSSINGVTSYNLKWIVTPAEFVAAVQSGSFTNNKELSVNYVWKAADNSGDVKFTMKMTVNAPSFSLDCNYNTYWNDDKSAFTMNPIVYGTENAKEKCTINVNILGTFHSIKGGDLSHILDVVKANNFSGTPDDAQIIFDEAACKNMAGAWGVQANRIVVDADGKQLKINSEIAAIIDENDNIVLNEGTGTNPITSGTDLYGTTMSTPTGAAKRLVGSYIPLKVLVTPCTTVDYTYTAKSFRVNVIDPFSIEPRLTDEVFYESRIDGSRVDVANGLRMTDWNGYLVANILDGSLTGDKSKYTQSLYNYYGIENIEWDTNKATTNLTYVNGILSPGNVKNGRFPDKAAFSYDKDNNQLVYMNNGYTLNKEFIIYCPVKVTHRWGVAETTVAITVKPGSGNE